MTVTGNDSIILQVYLDQSTDKFPRRPTGWLNCASVCLNLKGKKLCGNNFTADVLSIDYGWSYDKSACLFGYKNGNKVWFDVVVLFNPKAHTCSACFRLRLCVWLIDIRQHDITLRSPGHLLLELPSST